MRKAIITKTHLCNFDPLKPHFYIIKLGFTGVYIIFLISAQNIHCGYLLELPQWGSSNEYPQWIFWAEIRKISEFLSENFQFLEVKFSTYLNRRVFGMQISYGCGVINDCIFCSTELLGPFNHFIYFRLVFVSSIFRFCRSSLFGWKRRNNGKHKQFLHVIMNQSNFKYLFATSVKCSDYKTLPFFHKLAKTYSFCGRCFHTTVEWQIGY